MYVYICIYKYTFIYLRNYKYCCRLVYSNSYKQTLVIHTIQELDKRTKEQDLRMKEQDQRIKELEDLAR